MKTIMTFVLFCCTLFVQAQDKKIEKQTVDASCGQCKFGMKGKKGCDLAVKIDNQTYFVEGAKMDQFGDAHGNDGMCNTVRKAEVSGEIKGDKFIASSFKILPVAGQKHDAHDGHKH